MGYHSTLFTNKDLRKALKKAFPEIPIDWWRLEFIKKASTKHRCIIEDGNAVIVHGNGFIARARRGVR